MPASTDLTLLLDIISDGGLSKDESHTDARAHSIPFDESLPATSIIHESFAGHNIPPYPETNRIDEAWFPYEMHRDAHINGGVKHLIPRAGTFRQGGRTKSLHPESSGSIR